LAVFIAMKNIQMIERCSIDPKHWDDFVDRSFFRHPCLRSAYLDAVYPSWSALILGDWVAALPVMIQKKYGFRYAAAFPLVQQTGCISPGQVSIDTFIDFLDQKISLIEIPANETDHTDLNHEKYSNYCLDISRDYVDISAQYNTNTKRNIKKALGHGLELRHNTDVEKAVSFFRVNNSKNKLKANHFNIVRKLLNNYSKTSCKCFEVVNKEGVVVSMSIFTVAMDRHVYTLSASTEQGKNEGGLFFLIDQYIQNHCGNDSRLIDFEGSNISGIAQFYAGFGASDRPYPFIRINNLPWPLKLFKQSN